MFITFCLLFTYLSNTKYNKEFGMQQHTYIIGASNKPLFHLNCSFSLTHNIEPSKRVSELQLLLNKSNR